MNFNTKKESSRIFSKTSNQKNCFLTGATGGLGKEIAMQLVKSGYNLFLTSTNNKSLKKLKNELLLINNNSKIHYDFGDLNKINDTEKIICSCRKYFHSIDIVINCAGIFLVKSIQKSSLIDFEQSFNVNCRAPFIFSKEFSKDMVRKKWGRIVNIGSSSSYSGFKDTSIYCASKHAILGFSRSFHNELKEKNVRTIIISPGSVKTPMGKKVKNQNFKDFINPKEISELLIHLLQLDNEMIIDEIRLNRMIVS
jgi:3-oxoacyl-[acyl-carrier protein] reductase